ncbi:hypothetical protein [Sulfurimonas sp. HSL3-7]|uniref:hypothetical protein n=1 Tax=Sulfonitrofixus jiaomeiensis TaxID=3131938 RepID=UPI0031F81521
MKKTMLLALALSTTLLACPKGNCPQAANQGAGKQCTAQNCNSKQRLGSVSETLYYALDIMKMQDRPEIRMAIKSYQMNLAGIQRGMDTHAFKDGKFDKELYLRNSAHTKKVNAQVKLFEEIYAVLNSAEKKRLHQLMSAHQTYVKGFKEQRLKSCPNRQK